MNTQDAFPLHWPTAWKRTLATQRREAPFFSTSRQQSSVPGGSSWLSKRKKSMEDAVRFLYEEFERLGVRDDRIVVSTNVERRLDGQPYSNRKPPEDSGAAVYFTMKGKPCVLACDKWLRVEDNLYAIAKHVEALRGQDRWGVGSVEQAFAGYTALPAPGDSGSATWYQVLGVSAECTFEQAKEAYIREAKLCHPDNGGSNESMQRLNASWDQARKAFGQ